MNIANGFLVVASRAAEYVLSANFCAASIKDNYPDSHITLFVPDQLKQHVDKSAFDLVVTEGVPNHIRTKLYALSRTPYKNLTVYVDADMECRHSDVQNIWTEIDEKEDILITRIREYNGRIVRWKNGKLIHHCGFFMYRTNAKTIDFMQKWWENYVQQREEPWPYTEEEYPKLLRQWDQFTFWKMLKEDKHGINIDFFKNDDARWNFVNGYVAEETKQPIIFYHHTIPSKHGDIGL